MKKLFLILITFFAIIGFAHFSSAASFSGDGTHTLFNGDEVELKNGVWVRPAFAFASESKVNLVFYTGSQNDSSSELIIGTDFLQTNMSETQQLAEGTVSYVVSAIDRSSSNPSITVSFATAVASELEVSDLNVKMLTNTFADGPATYITWKTNFLTTNKVIACTQKNCTNPNIAETVTYNEQTGEFSRPLYEEHMVQHRKLAYDTTYYYKIQGETSTGDVVDYPAGSDNWLTFTTGPEPKSTFTPKIGYYQNTVVVEWITDEATNATVLYGETVPNREYPDGTTPKKEHKVQIPLDKDTTYQLKIVTYHPNNTVSFSNQYQVKLIRDDNLTKPAEYIPDTNAVQESIPISSPTESEQPTETPQTSDLVSRLQGKILLQVEANGEAWYVDPVSRQRFYLKDGTTAYQALRTFGLGITDADLATIPVGFSEMTGTDSDNDGLIDAIEDALGTNPLMNDSDSDGFNDYIEISNGYNPLGSGRLTIDTNAQSRLKGRILLQVEQQGQAWYVNPDDGKRYYLKDANAAYTIMRLLSLGITNTDLATIPSGNL